MFANPDGTRGGAGLVEFGVTGDGRFLMTRSGDAVRANVVAGVVGGHIFHFVSGIRHDRAQALHPLRVLFQAVDVREWFGLGGKPRVQLAVLFASVSAFAGLASLEKSLGHFGNR